MKIGFCPVCSENFDKLIEKKERVDIENSEKFDCPQCGTELFLNKNKNVTSINSEKTNLSKYPTITMGLEVEMFSIDLNTMQFRTLAPIYPKNGIEKDEKYVDDMTIGSEFNSPAFTSINESLFRLKTGLRKYFVNLETAEDKRIALMGSYDLEMETAGVHYHFGFDLKKGITEKEAELIAPHIHQQIPFIIAITGNSPIIREKITNNASNRLLTNGEAMFVAIDRKDIQDFSYTSHFHEINYNENPGKKPPTLEIRVTDSNIPEYIMAGLFIAYISTIGALKGKKLWKYYDFKKHRKNRIEAAKKGAKASIHWNKVKLPIPKYVDAFFNFYKTEIKETNVSEDILQVFRLARSWWNMADIMREAYKKIHSKFKKKGEDFISQEFCRKILEAQRKNLNGENIISYAKHMNVKIPSIEGVKLGKYF